MWKYMAAAFVITLYGIWRVFGKDEDFRSRTLALSAALSLAITVLVFPYYHLDDDLPIAVIESIRAGISGIAMGVNGSIPYELEMERNEFLAYRTFLYFLYIIGPLAGSMFLFSFSSALRSAISFFGKKRFHVFSSLNERSMMIARSIVDEKIGGMLIFCNCEECDEYLKNEAREMNALCLNTTIDQIHLKKNKYYEFYMLEEDDHESVVTAACFCNRVRKHKNYDPKKVIVRVFAGDDQRELILNLDKQYADEVFLRHIDEKHSLAVEGMFLCMDEAASKADCHAAVICDSDAAIGFVKDLLCLLIRPNSSPIVSMIGPKAAALYDEFRRQAPEGDRYDLKVFNCPYGKESDAFDSLPDPDIVFVLYEDDETAYETAARIRRDLVARNKDLKSPKIFCRIENSDLHRIIKEEDIILFGETKSFFTYSKLITPKLEEAAKRVHLSYLSKQDEEDQEKVLEETGFYRYQNQEASFAEALALCFKQRYILSFKDDDSLSDEEFITKWLSDEKNLQKMADAEHDRWSAYERVHGWRQANREQTAAIIKKYDGRRANDPELKLHPAIVSNEELYDCERMVNDLFKEYGSDKKVYYCDADKAIVEKINYILSDKKNG